MDDPFFGLVCSDGKKLELKNFDLFIVFCAERRLGLNFYKARKVSIRLSFSFFQVFDYKRLNLDYSYEYG